MGVTRTATSDAATTLAAADIELMDWQPVPGHPGVWHKTLRHSGTGGAALIRFDPGASTPGHPHPDAEHHIWVLYGEATVAGRAVLTGGYAYVPAGELHPIRNTGPTALQLVQIHHRCRQDGPGWTDG